MTLLLPTHTGIKIFVTKLLTQMDKVKLKAVLPTYIKEFKILYLENVAAEALEFFGFCGALQEVRELGVAHLGSGGVIQEPIGGATNSGNTDVDTDGHVTEKQPLCDQSLFGGPEKKNI